MKDRTNAVCVRILNHGKILAKVSADDAVAASSISCWLLNFSLKQNERFSIVPNEKIVKDVENICSRLHFQIIYEKYINERKVSSN